MAELNQNTPATVPEQPVAMENPVGALAAACLGVGEVFKRLIKLRPERGEMLDGFSFSLRSYLAGDTDCGPALPSSLKVDLLLVGGGAIRNRCRFRAC
jgi:hypothetical protein